MARPHRLLWRGQLLCDQFGCDAPPGAHGSHWLGGCELADRQWLCDCYSLCSRGPAPCNKQHRMGVIDFFRPFSDRAGKSFAGAGDQNRRPRFHEFDQLSSAALVCYFWNSFVE